LKIKNNRPMRKIILLLLIAAALGACNKKALQIHASVEGCSFSKSALMYDSLVVVSVQKLNYDTTNSSNLLKNRFSNRSINIAQDLGIYGLLCEYTRIEASKNLDSRFNGLRIDLQQQISLGYADINSIQAELACEIARMEELQKHLAGWINKKVNQATVYSIIIGAASTILAGGLAIEGASTQKEQAVAVAGAVAASYLGFKSLAIKKTILYEHKRNHLEDFLLKKNKTAIYPPFIWNFMTKIFVKNAYSTTGQQQILDDFKRLEYPVPHDDKNYQNKINLFAGASGKYSLDDLETRIDMYKLIQKEIDLINYDLKRLQQEIQIGYKP